MNIITIAALLLTLCLCKGLDMDEKCEPQGDEEKGLLSMTGLLEFAEKLSVDHQHGAWLQIGANSMSKELALSNPIMLTLDKVPTWEKYFLEPVPHVYEELVENVKRWQNVTTIFSALSTNGGYYEGMTKMYCLDGFEKSTHELADQVCSFDRKHVLKHFPKATVTEIDVSEMSMQVLIRMYHIVDVRIMVIDTEGFDGKVIESMPFSIIRPPMIVYEMVHLTKQERAAANAYLINHCYHIYFDSEGENTYAIHKSFQSFMEQ